MQRRIRIVEFLKKKKILMVRYQMERRNM